VGGATRGGGVLGRLGRGAPRTARRPPALRRECVAGPESRTAALSSLSLWILFRCFFVPPPTFLQFSPPAGRNCLLMRLFYSVRELLEGMRFSNGLIPCRVFVPLFPSSVGLKLIRLRAGGANFRIYCFGGVLFISETRTADGYKSINHFARATAIKVRRVIKFLRATGTPPTCHAPWGCDFAQTAACNLRDAIGSRHCVLQSSPKWVIVFIVHVLLNIWARTNADFSPRYANYRHNVNLLLFICII
jgi:hypothetical protein